MRRSTPRAVLLAGVLLATSCGGPSVTRAVTMSASLSGHGPITFVTGADTSGYLRPLVSKWNARHPGEKVTLIQLPADADDQHAQMVANLQARNGLYDVLNLDVIWTPEFASQGWVVPLNQKLFPLAQFLTPAVDTAEWDGRLWAVPYTSNAGLLYYRTDILAKARAQPPRTWAQLAHLASTVAPRYHMYGYSGQYLLYEGLTVNFAEAIQSAGGAILSADGKRVDLDSRQALRNWPLAYGLASRASRANVVVGKFGVVPLPGPAGPGSSALVGGDLAISAFSRHQRTALAFIQFLTSLATQRQILVSGSLPPVWTRLYGDPALIKRFPYLPVLKRAILSAEPRPKSTSYNQLSLAIASSVYQALTLRKPVNQTITSLSAQLNNISRNG